MTMFNVGGSGSGDSGYSAGAAARANSAANRAADAAKHLEDKVEKLTLVCMAMWSLVQEKTQLTEQDLLERVKLLDQMDGVDDGKATKSVGKCDKCGRTMNARHKHCLYCGYTRPITSAFDLL